MDLSRDVVINGKKAWMRKYVGRVSDIRQWQETWATGNVNVGYTQHRADKQKFWVVSDEFEKEVHSNINVRDEHVVSLVYGGYEGESGPLLLTYNNTLGEYSIETDSWKKTLEKKPFLRGLLALFVFPFSSTPAFVLSFLMLSLVGANNLDVVLLFVLLYLFVLFLIWFPLRKVEKFLDKLITEAILFAKE